MPPLMGNTLATSVSRLTSIAVILWLTSTIPPAEADTTFTLMSIWRLPGTPSEERWLEVHQIEGSDAGTLFHISVLSRKRGAPVWSLEHLVPHMAVTESALHRSVIGPAPKERMSYPEQYNEGYDQWRKLRAQSSAPICETSVLDCANLLR